MKTHSSTGEPDGLQSMEATKSLTRLKQLSTHTCTSMSINILEKISGKNQRLRLFQITCKRQRDRQPAGGDKTALEILLKGCRHLTPSVLGSWQTDVSLSKD